jgi:hypothetical protein
MSSKELKNKTIEFLNSLEGYHQVLKELHWSTTNHSQHVLTDEIDEDILEYEDKIAECIMGRLNIRFGLGDLKTLLPEAKTLDTLTNELLADTVSFKKSVEEDILNSGLVNILDDLISDINKWNYLKTLS